jgi:hypothetical protein
MKILAENVVFSNPSYGWNAQINIFRFDNSSKIHWSFVSAKALRNTWDSVPCGNLNSFYDWVNNSVDDFVNHVRSCVA